jgi:hypothetical protein
MTDHTTHADQATRAQITSGLRQLADYLDTHPAIPVAPYGWDLLVSTCNDTDDAGITEVDRIATVLGVPVRDDTSDGGHYTAARPSARSPTRRSISRPAAWPPTALT